MALGMDRRAFLPGGLKAERVELVDDRVLIHTRGGPGAFRTWSVISVLSWVGGQLRP